MHLARLAGGGVPRAGISLEGHLLRAGRPEPPTAQRYGGGFVISAFAARCVRSRVSHTPPPGRREEMQASGMRDRVALVTGTASLKSLSLFMVPLERVEVFWNRGIPESVVI